MTTSKPFKIAGIVDGAPFDPRTWSGASHHFFGELRDQDHLCAAVTGLPHEALLLMYKLRNFRLPLASWKFCYHLDTGLYKRMYRTARRKLRSIEQAFDHILQINVWFNAPRIASEYNGVSTSSYEGSNLITLLDSPYGHPHVPDRIIDNALAFEKRVYGNLDFVFTRSEWARKSFIDDYCIPEGKVVSIGTGINFERIPEKYHKNYGSKRLLFIGTDFRRKGGDYLIAAFAKVRKSIKDVRLTVIGPQLTDLPAGVECLGFLPQGTKEGRRKIVDAYRNAAIFVMPSLYEPFGNVFLEAMAFMVPCIGTTACAMPEIIQNGQTGYTVPPADADALADCIARALENPGELAAMGDAAYEAVRQKFDWNVVVRHMIKTLTKSE
ncbi:MAG: glycosyltransferase family 4 protein [Proteobacteria bacterium]|nr:glycosyltransferase family 4 protein [Pseudomonadota bacterium]